MSGRYLYCPQYDEATATCLVAHEYVEGMSMLPPLSAEDGAQVGKLLLLCFASVWVVSLIRKAISDRVES